MKPTDKIARRLALLEGVDLSQAYLNATAAEIEDLDRIVAELEEFAQGTPWVTQQLQPATSKT
jgi:predicted TPR repeat methyltransferase